MSNMDIKFSPEAIPNGREALGAVIDVLSLGEQFLHAFWSTARLPLTHIRVLRAIERGCTSASSITRDVGIPPSSLSRIFDRLEQRGLITRQIDQEDRRRILVAFTSTGEAKLAEMPRLASTPLMSALHALSDEERQALVIGVSALVREARKTAGDEAE